MIFHQCNCVSIGAKGLALQIFNKYPYLNTYKNRNTYKNQPGTISVHSGSTGDKVIINAYAQYYPGAANFLEQLAKINDVNGMDIAMPYNIGCELAGGDWEIYYQMINNFSNKYNINITLYRL